MVCKFLVIVFICLNDLIEYGLNINDLLLFLIIFLLLNVIIVFLGFNLWDMYKCFLFLDFCKFVEVLKIFLNNCLIVLLLNGFLLLLIKLLSIFFLCCGL